MLPKIIDMHTHIGGIKPLLFKIFKSKNQPIYDITGFKQIYKLATVDEDIVQSILYYVGMGISLTGLNVVNNEPQLKTIRKAKYVDQIVVLANDARVDENGELDYQGSKMYVSNDYVMKFCDRENNIDVRKNNPERFIPGISINPLRVDAFDVLKKLNSDGAKIIKLFPSTQEWHADGVDQEGNIMQYLERLKDFYQALKEAKMLVMVHTGVEDVIFSEEYFRVHGGDIENLSLLIDSGATVVGAHAGSHFGFYKKHHGRHNQFEEAKAALKKYDNFYGDAAGGLAAGFGFMPTITEIYDDNIEKMIYGSDLPCALAKPGKALKKLKKEDQDNKYIQIAIRLFSDMVVNDELMKTKNIYDLHYLMTKSVLNTIGISPERQQDFFARGYKLITNN